MKNLMILVTMLLSFSAFAETMPLHNSKQLQLWLDADHKGSIHTVSGRVQTWDDRSHNKYEFSAIAPGQRPIYVAAAKHSSASVVFQGVGRSEGGNALVGPAVEILPPGSLFSMFVVAEETDYVGSLDFPTIINFFSTLPGQNPQFCFVNQVNVHDDMYFGANVGPWGYGTGATSLATPLVGTLRYYEVTYNGASVSMYENQDELSTFTADTGSGDNQNIIGALTPGGLFGWSGPIKEIVLLVDRTVTATERSAMRSYLSEKHIQ